MTPSIRLKVKSKKVGSEQLVPKIPITPIANRLMQGMSEHWKASLMTGRKPSGAPLPKNEKGGALGLGKGSFVKAMVAGQPKARARKGRKLRANVARARLQLMGLDDRHAIAWNDLHKNKGMDFQSKAFAGRANTLWKKLIDEEMQKLAKKLARSMSAKSKTEPPPIQE